MIDTDHYVEGRMLIDFEKIKAQLASLHAGQPFFRGNHYALR